MHRYWAADRGQSKHTQARSRSPQDQCGSTPGLSLPSQTEGDGLASDLTHAQSRSGDDPRGSPFGPVTDPDAVLTSQMATRCYRDPRRVCVTPTVEVRHVGQLPCAQPGRGFASTARAALPANLSAVGWPMHRHLQSLCAPLAQWQSNGLLIRRFRVRIPGGAPNGLH